MFLVVVFLIVVFLIVVFLSAPSDSPSLSTLPPSPLSLPLHSPSLSPSSAHTMSAIAFDPSVQSEVPVPRFFGSAATLHDRM